MFNETYVFQAQDRKSLKLARQNIDSKDEHLNRIEMAMRLAALIRKEREASNWTQRELASRSGTLPMVVSQLEGGLYRSIGQMALRVLYTLGIEAYVIKTSSHDGEQTVFVYDKEVNQALRKATDALSLPSRTQGRPVSTATWRPRTQLRIEEQILRRTDLKSARELLKAFADEQEREFVERERREMKPYEIKRASPRFYDAVKTMAALTGEKLSNLP